jgi:hypothetical protein
METTAAFRSGASIQGLIRSSSARDSNLRRVLRSIWERDGISRVELSRLLALDKSTVTDIVACLLSSGLVSEGDEGSASLLGGRKPIALHVDPDRGYFIGVEAGISRCRVCAVDLRGDVRSERIVATPSGRLSPFESALAAARLGTAEPGGPGGPLLGIGIGLPPGAKERGAVDSPIPALACDEAQCCCWSELVGRGAAGDDSFIFLLGDRRGEGEGGDPSALNCSLAAAIDGRVRGGMDLRVGDRRGGVSAAELVAYLRLIADALDISRVVIGGMPRRWEEAISRDLGECSCFGVSSTPSRSCSVSSSRCGERVVAQGAASMMLARLFAAPAAAGAPAVIAV